MPALDGLLGNFIGGRDHAHIHFEFRLAAQAAHLRILQNAQQLGLRRHRHFADFIEQQRAVLRHFEAAGAALRRAREGAFFVAEQLAFNQRFRQRRAVDGDERALTARAKRMYRPRHHLLSSAALAGDQYASFARSGLLQQGKNFLHPGRCAYHLAQCALVTSCRSRLRFSARKPAWLPARRSRTSSDARLNRLFKKPVGA